MMSNLETISRAACSVKCAKINGVSKLPYCHEVAMLLRKALRPRAMRPATCSNHLPCSFLHSHPACLQRERLQREGAGACLSTFPSSCPPSM